MRSIERRLCHVEDKSLVKDLLDRDLLPGRRCLPTAERISSKKVGHGSTASKQDRRVSAATLRRVPTAAELLLPVILVRVFPAVLHEPILLVRVFSAVLREPLHLLLR